MLYVSGASVDYVKVEEIVASVVHTPLGPHCWLIQRLRDRNRLAARLEAAMPPEPDTYTLLFCPVSDSSVLRSRSIGRGQNLFHWLQDQRKADPA